MIFKSGKKKYEVASRHKTIEISHVHDPIDPSIDLISSSKFTTCMIHVCDIQDTSNQQYRNSLFRMNVHILPDCSILRKSQDMHKLN